MADVQNAVLWTFWRHGSGWVTFGVVRFRVISGINVAGETRLGGGEIDVNSEERGQARGQKQSA